MKEKSKSIVRQALIRLLCCLLAAAILGLAAYTAYGYLFKTHAIKTTLRCELPEDGRLVDYSFFPGKLTATLTFPRDEYDTVKKSLRDCYFRETSPTWVKRLEIGYLEDKELELAEYLVGDVGDMPWDDFCGMLCRAGDETILYVTQPSGAISEKWRER